MTLANVQITDIFLTWLTRTNQIITYLNSLTDTTGNVNALMANTFTSNVITANTLTINGPEVANTITANSIVTTSITSGTITGTGTSTQNIITANTLTISLGSTQNNITANTISLTSYANIAGLNIIPGFVASFGVANQAFARAYASVLEAGDTMTGNLTMRGANVSFSNIGTGINWQSNGVTGIFQSGANTISFWTSGQSQWKIDLSGFLLGGYANSQGSFFLQANGPALASAYYFNGTNFSGVGSTYITTDIQNNIELFSNLTQIAYFLGNPQGGPSHAIPGAGALIGLFGGVYTAGGSFSANLGTAYTLFPTWETYRESGTYLVSVYDNTFGGSGVFGIIMDSGLSGTHVLAQWQQGSGGGIVLGTSGDSVTVTQNNGVTDTLSWRLLLINP